MSRPTTFAIMAPETPASPSASETTSQNTSKVAGKPTGRKGVGRDLKIGRKPETTEPSLGWVSKVHGHCALAGNQVVNKKTTNKQQAQASEQEPLPSATTLTNANKKLRRSNTRRPKATREPSPPRLIYRPWRAKKDVIITSDRVTRNIVRQVGEHGGDGKYHWISTDEFNPETYDLAADLETMPMDEQKTFWTKNYAEIDLEAYDLAVGSSGISKVIAHMDQFGKVFIDNNLRIFINIDLSGPTTARPRGASVLSVPTIALLVPLAEKLSTFKALERCMVILSTPADNYLDWQWLDHAVPFKCLNLPVDFMWKPDRLPQQVVRGEHLHHLNLEWAKAKKELAAKADEGKRA